MHSSGRTYWEEREEGIPSLGRSNMRLFVELGSDLSLFRLYVGMGITSNARVAKYSFCLIVAACVRYIARQQ